MPSQSRTIIELADSGYVPVLKDSVVYYGGNQMWFPEASWFSRNYVIHNYGCGTIATADLFLYLAIKSNANRNAITEAVLQGTDSVYYTDYMSYISKIDSSYTKTKRWIAVLGPKIASAINSYSNSYRMNYHANWRLSLSYYDMLEAMEEMLSNDIPVILSIGPNTPNLWGKKGIKFYQQYTVEYECPSDKLLPLKKILYRYKPVKQDINSHYVTVTGIYKDASVPNVMLRISSWGKQFYINYEEYRDYINECSGTYTSSIVYIS